MTDENRVAQFPDRASRSWRWMRDELNALYIDKGWQPEIVDRSIEVVGEIYKRLRDLPAISADDPEDVVAAVNAWITSVVMGLLIEIANREIAMVNAGLRD